MKKTSMILGILIFTLAAFTGCGNRESKTTRASSATETNALEDGSNATLTATIVELNDETMLLAAAEEAAASSDLYRVPVTLKQRTNGKARTLLKIGMTIKVGYNGDIQESYPASLSAPAYYEIVEEGNDLVSFYIKLVEELIQADSVLSENAQIIALDLSETDNLSPSEKSALVYLIADKYQVECRNATFEELIESGDITKDPTGFTKGILLSFDTESEREKSFLLSYSLYKASEGAIGWDDAQATYKNGVWELKEGVAWIT